MEIINQRVPLNSHIDKNGVLHIVQDTTFNQPLRVYSQDTGSHLDFSRYTIKGGIKSNPSDPIGVEFVITRPSPDQILITLPYEQTLKMMAGFYSYEVESLSNETGIKENLIRGRAIVYKNID